MRITKTPDGLSVEGNQVRVRYAAGLNTGSLEFDARAGDEWRLLAASKRNTPTLKRFTLVTGPAMRTARAEVVFGQRLVDVSRGKKHAVITLEGRGGAHRAAMEITVPEEGKHVRVRVSIRLAGRVRVARLYVPYLYLPGGKLLEAYEPLDFVWAPNLRKRREHVLADQVFRSPAVMLQKGRDFAALAPDLHLLAEHRPLPTAMDLRLRPHGVGAPEFSYGFQPYRVDGHVYFRRGAAAPAAGELRFGYYLLLDAEAPPAHGYSGAARFLWDTFGREHMRRVEPQTLPFDNYAHYAYDYAFHRARLWTGFDMNEKPVGGTLALTFTGRARPHVMNRRELDATLRLKKLTPALQRFGTDNLLTSPLANDLSEVALHLYPPAVPPLLLNQCWFNNLRTAYGIHAYGKQWNDFDLIEKARRMKELALRAPGRDGLFATVCYVAEGEPLWYEGTRAFEPTHAYHVPDCAWTAHWMLNWHEDHERDPRLLQRAREFADFCIAAQRPSGAIPAWVRFRDGKHEAEETLLESAESAAPGLALAHYGFLARCRPAVAAAERVADFLIENVFPGNRWWDFETFFSCSKKDIGMKDADTGLVPHNNLSIAWAAEMFKYLYLATRKARWLEWGTRALDTLCLYQQVWDAPYVSINTFGGFGVMNTDGEWNDARQSLFANLLLDYYRLTREPEYFERGVAALRASFTLMLIPENRSVAPGNLGRMRARHHGAVYENYAHLGFDRRAPGYVMFDWGGGGACAAAARARLHYGDVFVDGKARRAFGINGVLVENADFRRSAVALDIYSPLLSNRKILIKMNDMPKGTHQVKINGRSLGRHDARALERGLWMELKNPELE